MSWRLFLGIPLTLIALAALVQMLTINAASGLPFNTIKCGTMQCVSPQPGIPLPSALKTGDELLMQQMSVPARAAVLAQTRLKAGQTYNLVVRRDGQVFSVPVTTRNFSITGESLWNLRSGQVLVFVLMILALLAIWRGKNLAAWGLGLFALAIITQIGLRQFPLSAMGATWIGILVVAGVMPVILLGLYLMAYSLSAEGLGRRVKRAITIVFVVCYGLFVLVTVAVLYSSVYYDTQWTSGLQSIITAAAFFGMGVLAFLLLVFGYAHAGAEQRLRMRWILYSTGGVLLGFILQIGSLLSSNAVFQLTTVNIGILIIILAVVGYTYAVLRQRLVDVRIVLNRTLVYGVITAVVVGVFAAINVLVDHATFGHGASLLLELFVPLALGVALDGLRKYLDRYLSRLVFRRQYRAEKALGDFARTCGFIEDAEHLLDATVQQVFEHSRAQSVALYERDNHGYRRARQLGVEQFPPRAETDDMAFVRLRAGDHESDLHDVASKLGHSGYVFAMVVRGELIGALVCGPRPAEHYAANERALLFHVTQQAGTALHALRTRAQENFVATIASGVLDSAKAQVQARELLTGWQNV